jgi:hypothetical protein
MLLLLRCLISLMILLPTIALSHGGRTDANGGHYNRKTGEYHYHNGGPPSAAKSASSESNEPQGQMVYVTRTGKKYHRDGCTHLKSRIPISLKEAKHRYAPCKVCMPPA